MTTVRSRRLVVGLAMRLKVLASIGIVGATAGTASLATFGTFTSTTTAAQTVSSATVALTYANGGYTNNLGVNASGMVAGDTVYRAFKLTDGVAMSSMTMGVSGTGLLVTGTAGLKAQLDECSTAWTESSGTFTCSATTTSVMIPTTLSTLSTTAQAMGSSVLTSGDHWMLMTTTLPPNADNTYQGQSSAVTFTFTGVARAADSVH